MIYPVLASWHEGIRGLGVFARRAKGAGRARLTRRDAIATPIEAALLKTYHALQVVIAVSETIVIDTAFLRGTRPSVHLYCLTNRAVRLGQ